MTGPAVVVVDAGTGNLGSVVNALQSLGAQVSLAASPAQMESARKLVLPGVGAFGHFMNGLRERGLEPGLREAVRAGVPLLGICVGMQAFFDTSEESETQPGLSLLPGTVTRFPDLPGLKVPHTGWNELVPVRGSPLLEGLSPVSHAYFNHSYRCLPALPEDVIAHTDYAGEFASLVQRGALFGVQFHPEKSQRVGLRILQNFLSF